MPSGMVTFDMYGLLNVMGANAVTLKVRPLYVQVAYLIASEETEKREFGSLDNIKDNYPKYVFSMTPLVRRSDRQGVVHLGLREFLKNGFEKKLP